MFAQGAAESRFKQAQRKFCLRVDQLIVAAKQICNLLISSVSMKTIESPRVVSQDFIDRRGEDLTVRFEFPQRVDF
jgi:hypothetical protein